MTRYLRVYGKLLELHFNSLLSSDRGETILNMHGTRMWECKLSFAHLFLVCWFLSYCKYFGVCHQFYQPIFLLQIHNCPVTRICYFTILSPFFKINPFLKCFFQRFLLHIFYCCCHYFVTYVAIFPYLKKKLFNPIP